MANPEHTAIVRRGARALAAWRKKNKDKDLNLRDAMLEGVLLNGADLGFSDLRGANLAGAQLKGAVLTETDLYHADLREAQCSRARLYVANLRRAKLRGADLSFAFMFGSFLEEVDLRGAQLFAADLRTVDLARADLRGARLSHAILSERRPPSGADFSECECNFTVLGCFDLSVVRGLESVQHRGPSILSRDTLVASKGRIPEIFLRGCGLSDWEIAAAKLYDPELSANQISEIQYRVFDFRACSPIQIGSLFISYTHADAAFVDALEEKLNEKGIRFWRDVHHATAGPLDSIVDRAIRLNPTVLLVLSENSVESDWVEDEANRARELEKKLGRHVLCPIALDDAWKDCRWSRKLRTQIEKYNILPFNNWQNPTAFEGMFRRLVDGLAIFYQPDNAARHV